MVDERRTKRRHTQKEISEGRRKHLNVVDEMPLLVLGCLHKRCLPRAALCESRRRRRPKRLCSSVREGFKESEQARKNSGCKCVSDSHDALHLIDKIDLFLDLFFKQRKNAQLESTACSVTNQHYVPHTYDLLHHYNCINSITGPSVEKLNGKRLPATRPHTSTGSVV